MDFSIIKHPPVDNVDPSSGGRYPSWLAHVITSTLQMFDYCYPTTGIVQGSIVSIRNLLIALFIPFFVVNVNPRLINP